MYQRKESLNDKVSMQFVWTLKKRGIDSSSMSTSMLMYQWACFVNDLAINAHEYKGIETKVRFPKAMLMHRTETY